MFTTYTELMNAIIAKQGYRTYLEIGVQRGDNLSAIECEHKDGVDICCASPATFHLSSDDFFRKAMEEGLIYDLIFVDGDHRFLPALRDIVNALEVLSPNGTIFVDNINPAQYSDQVMHLDGTVWKAWAVLRVSRRDLSMLAIDTTPLGPHYGRGWGVIRRGRQEIFAHYESHAGLPCYFGEQWDLNWDFFSHFRESLMNMVTLEHFETTIWPEWFPT